MPVVKKNVIQMPARPTAAATRMSERKWGREVMDAKKFCIFPSLLLHAQARLKMTPTHLALVMHLIDFWWDADRKPWPSKNTLAERVGLSPRHVQRQMAELESMGLVTRVERRGHHRGKLSNEYDLSGLVARLKGLAPEFKAVEEEAKNKRQAVARAGLRKRVASGAED
jgi:DNA-binding HxlR family transcriptional regulator